MNEKINQIERNESEYKVTSRYPAKSPRINKEIKMTCVEFEGLKSNADQENFKRAFSRSGLRLADVKFEKNPLSHENTGKGLLLVETTNKEASERVKAKLVELGLKPTEQPNFHNKLR